MRNKVLLAVLLVAFSSCGSPIYAKSKKCKERGRVVEARIDELRKSADSMLPIGSSVEDTRRFFEANKLTMHLDKRLTRADDSFLMKGCGPSFFCGDSVLIVVQVKFNSFGKIEKKEVGGIYNNCL